MKWHYSHISRQNRKSLSLSSEKRIYQKYMNFDNKSKIVNKWFTDLKCAYFMCVCGKQTYFLASLQLQCRNGEMSKIKIMQCLKSKTKEGLFRKLSGFIYSQIV